MRHGHVNWTKRARRGSQAEAQKLARMAWQFFGPEGSIAPNTLPADHIAWQLFATTLATPNKEA